MSRSTFVKVLNDLHRLKQDELDTSDLSLVREYGKPDLFITMTCNPKWSEIVNELRPGQEPQDRPDIVARVFKDNMDQLMKDLIQRECFRKVVFFH